MSIKRNQILRCACDLYLSEGMEGFSMRKLAKCVGCTAPALYRHYENKDAVMQDLVAEAYRQFTQYLYRALEGGTPEERFRMAGQSYVDFAIEQPALYEIIYVPANLLGIHGGNSEAANQACAVGQFWSDRVREMMEAGLIKKGDPHQVSMTLWAHGHGLVSIYHRGLLPVQSEEAFRAMVVESYLRVISGVGTDTYQAILRGSSEGSNAETAHSKDWIEGVAGTASR